MHQEIVSGACYNMLFRCIACHSHCGFGMQVKPLDYCSAFPAHEDVKNPYKAHRKLGEDDGEPNPHRMLCAGLASVQ